MPTATDPHRRKGGKKPHQRQRDKRPPVVQPPANLAHLTGDELYQALIADTDIWDSWRLAEESGRGRRAVDIWIGHFNRYEAGLQPLNDNTIIKPVYFGDTPTWRAGEVRAWLMRTGRMRRDGVFIPHKPPGRPKGIPEARPRPRRGSVLDQVAPQVWQEYLTLIDPAGPHKLRPGQARTRLAETLQISEYAVIRRIQRGRQLAAGDQQTEPSAT